MSASRGERIRQARQLRRLSQQELAEATGLGTRTIRRIETGENDSPRSLTILETYLELAPPPGDVERQVDTTDQIDRATVERALRAATVLELLAALAGRYADLEATTRSGQPPQPGEPQRYTWYKEDAPTARGRAEDVTAPDAVFEWHKTDDADQAAENGA